MTKKSGGNPFSFPRNYMNSDLTLTLIRKKNMRTPISQLIVICGTIVTLEIISDPDDKSETFWFHNKVKTMPDSKCFSVEKTSAALLYIIADSYY